MKDLTKYFIDLSKCTEREIISIAFLTRRTVNLHNKAFSYMSKGETLKDFVCLAATDSGEWTLWNKNALFNKTELTYPDFIKLFEGGETIKSDNTQTLQNALQQIEKLEADKKELVEALQYVYGKYEKDGHLLNVSPSKIESLIQKHK